MEDNKLANLPKTPLLLEGVTYHLCGNFGALIEGEKFFNLRGHGINLLHAIWNVRDQQSAMDGARQLLPCALHTFHPKLSWAGAQAIIDRMVASDNGSFMRALGDMWPPATAEREEANRNLCFDLDSLAEADEHFRGQAGLGLMVDEGPLTLDHCCRIFPCAVHRFRPELNLHQARQLMSLPSIFLVVGKLGMVWEAASQKSKDRFIERVIATASTEEKEEILFRELAKKLSPVAAQA